ncbi:hypothetical protein pb186bvf_020777 [Paramecium bursaria]
MNQEEANLKIHQLGSCLKRYNLEQIISNGLLAGDLRSQIDSFGTHYVYYSLASENHQYKLGFFCTFTTENRIIEKDGMTSMMI